MNILVTGLMGSGKSTQARLLAEKLGYCFLTTGDVLREMAKRESAAAKEVKAALDKGLMVDDQIVADLIQKRLRETDCKEGFVSDSYPRHVGQIKYFDPKLEIIFYLKTSPQVAKQRLLERGRADDTPELIDQRHNTQGKKIIELVDHYRGKIKVADINGDKSIEEVHQDILAHLDNGK